MKKIFLLVALFFACTAGYSQDFKPFKFGIGLGYAVPSDGGGGVVFALEPAYRVNDALAVGLRLEWALTAKAVGDQEADIAASASYTVSGQYYLSNNSFRPFVGVGLGLFNNASASVDATTGGSDLEVGGGSTFGFYPRVGFDAGHFNLTLDYNIVGATKGETIDFGGATVTTDDIKNSYISIKFGAIIGGGRN